MKTRTLKLKNIIWVLAGLGPSGVPLSKAVASGKEKPAAEVETAAWQEI